MNSRLLLGVVAFSISFGIHLAASRQPRFAAGAGVATLPAVYIATAIVDRTRHRRLEQRLEELKTHIAVLQQKRQHAYLEFTAMQEEKERVALTLNSLQLQLRQRQLTEAEELPSLPPASEPQPPLSNPAPPIKPLSWNLSQPKEPEPRQELPGYQLPLTQLQDVANSQPEEPALEPANADLQSLQGVVRSLQQELNQLQTRLADNRKTREELNREINDLKQQKRKLEAETNSLKRELNRLEIRYTELEQSVSALEVKKQRKGQPHPLQTSQEQLQQQVSTLQAELHQLEGQVSDRQQQKQSLDQELANLKQQHQNQVTRAQQDLQRLEAQLVEQTTRKHKLERQLAELEAKPQPRSAQPPPANKPNSKPNSSAKAAQAAQQSAPQTNGQTATTTETTSKTSHELPDDWMDFLGQMPDYELEVLRAVAEQSQPGATIKRIAEENLTMPELLIDSINEKSLETIGDLVITAEQGANTAKVVREHAKLVKKLLRTYEFLTQ